MAKSIRIFAKARFSLRRPTTSFFAAFSLPEVPVLDIRPMPDVFPRLLLTGEFVYD